MGVLREDNASVLDRLSSPRSDQCLAFFFFFGLDFELPLGWT